ncbi:class I SAM-dependent methyltransferase [Mycolicibacter arupensis]|jgi:SAM-dependent methyltransferase|uniref:Methyltransferase n=1 Tax=Mycolicibacter arupensis TaxID=342002 RepID=A0A0F5MYA9_9MYCO|nr:class I SAM-dependent methyltransferase [Mycolicibacter arupensis]KAA1432953.1 class I SAM-dependent methyltransferase [Mycolicibacter arupensis]KKB99681.1 methyltransferase [Mycolicibacter arupensis]MCV7276196.1 class I SAM-dependent methyltransferase [Mycolicibacter arupensis]ORA01089.1 SAM-dependent methyltransferase [Mycolicibacter arupensis]TXI55869.1 MAG: class I SAM-dependent methyltransferase [Mycolicibacter arupensis]
MNSDTGVKDAPDASPPEPWDIGRPQPAVQQLVAYGALRGEVLDPGTGAGHHAIHYAAHGYSTTGLDHSPATIALAQRNAAQAGVHVDFQVADAVELAGFQGRFDTVVDSAFYHLFQDDEETQLRYARNLHRATKPQARLFLFEAGRHNVNGWQLDGMSPERFAPLLESAGWRIDHVGTTTYQGTFDPNAFTEMIAVMEAMGREDLLPGVRALAQRFAHLQPLLEDNMVHMPFWAVSATRIDQLLSP